MCSMLLQEVVGGGGGRVKVFWHLLWLALCSVLGTWWDKQVHCGLSPEHL